MKQNIFDLEVGDNKIVLTHEDLGHRLLKLPIARLPKDSYLLNIGCEVIRPFVGSVAPSLSSPTVSVSDVNLFSIVYRFKIGDSDDVNYFMDEIAPDTPGEYGANDGAYFSSPEAFDTPVDIYLESNVIPRTWTFSGDLNTAMSHSAGCGTQSAGLCFKSAITEEYNGVTWTASNALNTSSTLMAGAGTQTAGLKAGGTGGSKNETEEYDGTSWAASNALNVSRQELYGAGIQTAALSIGGYTPAMATTEEYDGTSWTQTNDLNIARWGNPASGTQTAALTFCGYGTTNLYSTEEYNGSTWTMANDNVLGGYEGGGCGLVSAALSFNLANAKKSSSEYDGTTWLMSNTTNVSRFTLTGFGSQSSAVSVGGYYDSLPSTYTEEYNEIDPSQVAIDGMMVLTFTVY